MRCLAFEKSPFGNWVAAEEEIRQKIRPQVKILWDESNIQTNHSFPAVEEMSNFEVVSTTLSS
jgi:hypothetical protein